MSSRHSYNYVGFLTQKSIVFTILIASIMLLIFISDLQFTTELYIGVLYIIVVMLSLWLPGTKYTFFFAVSSTALTILGYFYSIYSIAPNSYFHLTNFINLFLTISVIWITTIIAIYIKNISMALKRSETIHKAILDTSIDPIIIIGEYGIIDSASKTIETAFGWGVKEIIGQKFSNFLSHNYKDLYDKLLTTREDIEHSPLIGQTKEAIAIHRMHREFPCEISINFINIPEIEESIFAISLRDISMRKAYEEKLWWMSAHDELTKIYNRRYFNEQIIKEWQRSLRKQENLSIIIIDVDFFKNYNDSLGHQAGDLCLQKIATCLTDTCRRASDIVARYGGEEFILLLPYTDQQGAEIIANNIKEKISNLNIIHPNSAVGKKVSVSMGIATMVPIMGCSYERLVRFADQALYTAKHSGRNNFYTYKDS